MQPDLIRDASLRTGMEIERLIGEANELTAIFAVTDKTAKLKKSDILNQTQKNGCNSIFVNLKKQENGICRKKNYPATNCC